MADEKNWQFELTEYINELKNRYLHIDFQSDI